MRTKDSCYLRYYDNEDSADTETGRIIDDKSGVETLLRVLQNDKEKIKQQ